MASSSPYGMVDDAGCGLQALPSVTFHTEYPPSLWELTNKFPVRSHTRLSSCCTGGGPTHGGTLRTSRLQNAAHCAVADRQKPGLDPPACPRRAARSDGRPGPTAPPGRGCSQSESCLAAEDAPAETPPAPGIFHICNRLEGCGKERERLSERVIAHLWHI